ncbi:MAG: RHS repeat-associated core domain-containing protein, partial [Lachnospiraceae bacterium]|nr:RHS repeat-associated core domain-containing protein [Lachnospiraceae bacterium]
RHSYTYSSSTGELIKSVTGDAGGNTNYLTQYEYGLYNDTTGERLLKELRLNDDEVRVRYGYDSFYRTEKEVRLHTDYTLNTGCTYRQGTGTNSTSFLPETQTETLTDPDSNTVETVTLSYTYDSLGNIETISEGGIQRQKYYYDDLNQLVREDNLDLNKTIVYSYDLGGNIISTTEYAYQTGSTISGTPTITNTYSYTDSNWKDKLTSYNGNSISYDAIGNPLSYYNGFSFTWEKGRQLASATNGTDTVTYTYDHEGHRVSKTVNGVTSSYTLEGDKVLFERNGDTSLWYYYDASGAPVAIKVDNVIHLYRKNLQGDITGIYSGLTGELLVSYVYDAWGKPVITDEANTTESAELIELNPYLYRGYRYDQETGLYYLQSRYYDPETGRFVNADVFASTGDSNIACNMFAYCLNNPVNLTDAEGTWPNLSSVFLGIAIVAAAVAFVALCVVTCGGAAVVGAGAAVALSTTTAVATQVAVVAVGVSATSYAAASISYAVETSILESKKKNLDGKKPTPTNQLQKQVENDKAPKEVDRVDKRHSDKGKDHIHFKDKTAINLDGTKSHDGNGKPRITNRFREWMNENGYKGWLK